MPGSDPERRQCARESFGPGSRVRRRSDFERTYRGGIRLSGRFIVLLGCGNSEGHPRLGVAVGRKVGTAPTRNRLKRRLRELFRRDLSLRERSVDIVIAVRPGAGAASFEELRGEYCQARERLLRRVGQC